MSWRKWIIRYSVASRMMWTPKAPRKQTIRSRVTVDQRSLKMKIRNQTSQLYLMYQTYQLRQTSRMLQSNQMTRDCWTMMETPEGDPYEVPCICIIRVMTDG